MSEQIIDMVRCAGGNHVTLTVEDDVRGKRRTVLMMWEDFVAGDVRQAWRGHDDATAPLVADAIAKGKAEIDKGGGFDQVKAAAVKPAKG